jgi:hypothetical protein
MSPTQKPRTATSKASRVFSKEEQAAMKELVAERRRQSSGKADGESDVLAKIAEMPAHDRTIAERIHALIKATAPELLPRTWVRDARVCQGRRCRLFLSGRGQV